eukprot:7598501-Pyramimonas_sp.AAC.1
MSTKRKNLEGSSVDGDDRPSGRKGRNRRTWLMHAQTEWVRGYSWRAQMSRQEGAPIASPTFPAG